MALSLAGIGMGPVQVAGAADGDGGPAAAAELSTPSDVAVDSSGNLYIAEATRDRVRKVTPGGVISTFAGTGTVGFSGDGGPAANAQLDTPTGLAVDTAGNLYIADAGNARIRKVTAGGVISTVAGTGLFGFSGDGGPATNALLNNPNGVTVDAAGNLYIADSGNARIRKVTPGGVISTFAGLGTFGFSGDGGPATNAEIDNPTGVAVDTAGNLYIADAGNARIRKVSSGGIISTIAGTGTFGYSGDGGPATGAQLSSPSAVAVDSAGNLYIADSGNDRIRKVTPGGTISTIAGAGGFGFSGDGGPAVNAHLRTPVGVAVDSSGNVLLADVGNNRVRTVSAAGTISTAAGSGSEFVSVSPVRVFDTRPTEPNGAITVAKTVIGGAKVLKVKITGTAGVPASGVGAVALNVTAFAPTGAGFITVYPCGTRPLASNLNFTAGQTVPNSVIAPVSASGEICFYSNINTHIFADVSGWFGSSAGFSSLTPARVFDTRPTDPNGTITVPKTVIGGTNELKVKITGTAGVPASGVGAVALNVTAFAPTGAGFITVYPCGTRPLASNLNFTAGQTVPNSVIAPVSASGEICFYSNINTHIFADVSGWFGSSAGFSSLTPARVFDTRPTDPDGTVTVPKTVIGGTNELKVKITGTAGVPASGVGAVALNVTAFAPTGAGFITVYPCGTRPLASNLNFTAGQTVPNSVIAPVSASGEICFYSNINTHIFADVSGWFTS